MCVCMLHVLDWKGVTLRCNKPSPPPLVTYGRWQTTQIDRFDAGGVFCRFIETRGNFSPYVLIVKNHISFLYSFSFAIFIKIWGKSVHWIVSFEWTNKRSHKQITILLIQIIDMLCVSLGCYKLKLVRDLEEYYDPDLDMSREMQRSNEQIYFHVL